MGDDLRERIARAAAGGYMRVPIVALDGMRGRYEWRWRSCWLAATRAKVKSGTTGTRQQSPRLTRSTKSTCGN